MILNKYNEVMAYVTVSEETKDRILKEIRSAEPEQAKVVRFRNAKRYIALAACFAVVLIGVLAVTVTNRQPQPGDLQTAGPAVEYQSAKALSKASGIRIEDLKNLPLSRRRPPIWNIRPTSSRSSIPTERKACSTASPRAATKTPATITNTKR